jgi:hypothetical protein
MGAVNGFIYAIHVSHGKLDVILGSLKFSEFYLLVIFYCYYLFYYVFEVYISLYLKINL